MQSELNPSEIPPRNGFEVDQAPIQWVEPKIGRYGPRSVRVTTSAKTARFLAYALFIGAILGVVEVVRTGNADVGLLITGIAVLLTGLVVMMVEQGISTQRNVLRKFNAYPAVISSIGPVMLDTGRNPVYQVEVFYQSNQGPKSLSLQVMTSTLTRMKQEGSTVLLISPDGREKDTVFLSAIGYVEVSSN